MSGSARYEIVYTMVVKKEYTQGDLTIVWQPHLCIHSGVCFRSLPQVFKPRDRPWIQLQEEAREATIETVQACPSGAISIKHTPEEVEQLEEHMVDWTKVAVMKNGPLRIREACQITLPDGTQVEKPDGVSLCRCGESKNKPFCDGTHKLNGFTG